MSRIFILLAIGVFCCLLGPVAAGQKPADEPLVYPPTKTVDQTDELHGVTVADPYRWLEDLDSPETAAWVAAQNKLTFGWLEQIPAREKIKARMTHLWNFEKYGMPRKEGGKYFFSKNDGLQNQSVFYVADSLDAEPRVLLDPNTLSTDGTVALAGLAISEDGKYMAYGLSSAGSDWVEYKVRDVATGQDLEDHLKWIKFSGASWTKDGQGFFYSRFDEPKGNQLEETNYYQKLFYHRVGDPQSADRLVYHRPDEKEWGFGGNVTEDGRYLIITVTQGTEEKNRVYYQDLAANDGQTHVLLDDFDAQYAFVGNDGPLFWFFTNLDAPRGRLIAIDTQRPARANWVELIPQAEETLQGIGLVNDTFITSYLKDAHTVVRLFDLSGNHVRDLELPGMGTAGGFGGKRTDTETFYAFTSFSVPTDIYRYDMTTGQSTLYRRPKVDFNPDAFVTKQIFYHSKDGTRVPMFISHRKDLVLDGNNPTYLYGYGGFNASLTPYFSVSRLILMEMGGVVAMANLRGGGEYGEEWHQAGCLHNKQNVFDDFIAAAEWLIDNKYTRPAKLAIAGGSNGGLLVGACMNQRPELFGAALPAVGVMDMLRFHKFTIGWAWTSDYGSPDDPEDFKVLLAYSPLHNIKPGTCYPATLVTTADHDDRVVPSHSFKFISALQAAQSCANPVLIRIETKAGHSAGKPTTKIIEEIADEWAFLVRILGMDDSGLGATSENAQTEKAKQ
ncbi:MAG: prolyl oligopeptidase family serine peptidase [Phycisphaerae bacterium]|jgi:prolyl oligopeptidase